MSTKTVMAEGSGMGSACVLMEMECHAMDAKVLRWARLIQPLFLVSFALRNRRNPPNGEGYGEVEESLPSPDGDGSGRGRGYGYITGTGIGYGKHMGHYSGNGGSRGGGY